MLGTISFIALGGALGAVLRHGVNVAAVALFGHGFPWGTLAVNILGSFVMGALIAYLAHWGNLSPALRLFFVTGLLGAFTTFSTFSLDTITLWERGLELHAAAYVLASVVLSVSALLAAMVLVRSITG